MEDLKLLPPTKRPREKLLLHGADILSDAELLAIVFGSGSQNLPILQVCTQLLLNTSLKELPSADVKVLCKTKGIGPAKALVLLAIVELAERLHRKPMIHLPDDQAVAEQVRSILAASNGLNYLLVLMTRDRELLAICELGNVLPDLPRTLSLMTDAGAKRVQLVRNGWRQLCRIETVFQRDLEIACGALGIIVQDFLTLTAEP